MSKAPGFKEYPQHRVETRPASARVRVAYQGEVIADTRDAVEMHESMGEGKKTAAPVVYYIPRKDVDMTLLARTDHATYCPYKGDCAYYSIPLGGVRSTNAVWTYESPYAAVAAIRDYLAFYPDRVDAIEERSGG